MDIYKLYRDFWDYAFENTGEIKPNHIAIYSFAIEHCNRLGWKKKFGLPSAMAMEAIGIKSYNTYIDAFNKLVEIGFIELIEKSKNQYSSNIIALSVFNKANDKALDTALMKHDTKHTAKQHESTQQSTGESTQQSTGKSNCSIDKQIYNNTNIQIYRAFDHLSISIDEVEKLKSLGYTIGQIDKTLDELENYKNNKKYKSAFLTIKKWLPKPETNNFTFKQEMLNYGFDEILTDEWILVRDNKNATNTKTAFDDFTNKVFDAEVKYKITKNEILKICVARSWAVLHSSWLESELNNNQNVKQSANKESYDDALRRMANYQ